MSKNPNINSTGTAPERPNLVNSTTAPKTDKDNQIANKAAEKAGEREGLSSSREGIFTK